MKIKLKPSSVKIFLFGVFALGIMIFLGSYFGIYSNVRTDKLLTTFEERYSQMVVDENGEILGVYLNNEEQWHLKSEDEIPEKLKLAVINYEDKNFYSHSGVDLLAILRALKDNLLSKQRSGGSTITMQTTKLASPSKRTYINKYIEIIESIKIEKDFTKDEILLMYLNNAPYGGNIVGYKTASLLYFQKEPDKLTWAEAALLAVLPNSPGLINIEKNRTKLVEKRNKLLKKLETKGIIKKSQYEISKEEALPKKRYSFSSIAPHLTRRVTTESKEKIIETTINKELQEKIQVISNNYSNFLRGEGVKNLSVLVIDNETYEIKVYVGSGDFYDTKTNGQVDGVTALRSPGSVLKPFLYALAIDEGLIAPESKVVDVPKYYSNYSPQNASKKYHGMVEIRESLVKSLNIPFVSLLKEYGEEKFFYFLKEVTEFRENDSSTYGLSLILGTKEMKVEDVGKLYAGLGNYGKFQDLKYLKNEKSKEGSRLISKGASYLTLKTIQDLQRPGLSNLYKGKDGISWKTGTSYGKRDGWAVGVTPEWTVVVWVGNFTGEGNTNLTGVITGGRLLFNIFETLPRKKKFLPPLNNLKSIEVDEETGYRTNYDIPTREILYPKNAKPLKISPFYKKIFVDDSGNIIDSRSENFSERKEKIVLNYPLEVINYLNQKGIAIDEIYNNKINEKSIDILYPTNNLNVVLPRDFDGEKSVIIKIANIKNQNIYWYINDEYIGMDKSTEKSFNLKEGNYKLTLVGENGEIIIRKFQIEKK